MNHNECLAKNNKRRTECSPAAVAVPGCLAPHLTLHFTVFCKLSLSLPAAPTVGGAGFGLENTQTKYDNINREVSFT